MRYQVYDSCTDEVIWTDNPALIIADLIDPEAIDWTEVIAVVDTVDMEIDPHASR